MAWTDQMVEDLKRMWKEGLTTGEIGKRLNVSKNSIIGKVHRLGLSGRPSPIKKKTDTEAAKSTAAAKPAVEKENKTPTQPKPQPRPEVKTIAPSRKKVEVEVEVEIEADAKVKAEPIVSVSPKAEHPKEFLSLTDLDNHTCRWPLGDPKDENFHFCGKKVRIGQTYCEEHAALAYVKPSKK